ncbi:CAAX amino terminal protease family protein [Agrilactobacillus composti DSM 18527 = JCM 14202]|uniref:CAAX amino terminal protease family protein n=1 Tax=Agrilactobacillus composti DSM 18527 = JCM 14202 TaxID=1423734 RepID=X0PQB6_9LACO|nr:type II CAAX endopeptidase family protein [Agrilactobacillus composti]KRM32490.1 CAAX amino terminal protease family protein [Agrilactobacillus composti DSM 18527 = JCM 14202]GAF39927.1 CAAX amino terminal protease family protein [Agrilactobacillus composti DSM 18527 = JCM 14202]
MKARNSTAVTLFIYLFMMFMPNFFSRMLSPKNGYFLLITVWYLLGLLLLVWLAYKRTPANAIEAANPYTTKPKILIWGIVGGGVAIVLQLLSVFVEQNLFHITAVSQNTNALLETMKTYPYYVVSVLVFLPIIEEIVYRKTIFGQLVPFTGKIGAAIISALIFAFAHQDSHILMYSVIGLFFCFLYNYTGRIWTSMLAHIIMNGIVFFQSIH